MGKPLMAYGGLFEPRRRKPARAKRRLPNFAKMLSWFNSPMNCIFAGVVLAVGSILTVAAFNYEPSKPTPKPGLSLADALLDALPSEISQPEELSPSVAWSRVQEAARGQLKAPATASFPWSADQFSKTGEGYVIAGHVDSQNGFGAMVRTNFAAGLDRAGNVQYVLFDE
jgi:hypothetical protein